jgi:hypothetical protein
VCSENKTVLRYYFLEQKVKRYRNRSCEFYFPPFILGGKRFFTATIPTFFPTVVAI